MGNEGKSLPRGFSGISTMVSDVKDVVDEAKNQAQKHTNVKVQETDTSNNQESSVEDTITFNQNNKTYEGSSKLKWLLGICAIIIYIMFSSGSSQKQNIVPPRNAYTPTAPTTNVVPIPIKSEKLTFEMPPVGRNTVLNLPQLRWFFREKIKIEKMRNLVSNKKAMVEFNAMVDDFNSRCGSFRYHQHEFAQAEKEINAIREQIIADAKKDAMTRGWE